MRKKFNRIISSLLVLAFIISALSVFAFASDDSSDEGLDPKILYNRTFDEGWDYNNGLAGGNTAQTIYSIDYEESSDYSYNYFFRIETPVVNTSDSYAHFDFGVDVMKESGTVVEISVKVDDVVADLGTILYSITATNAQTNSYDKLEMLSLAGGKFTAFSSVTFGEQSGVVIGDAENEWVHVAYVFNWDGDDIGITVLYDKDPVSGKYQKSVTGSMAYVSGAKGIQDLYLGIPKTTAGNTDRAGVNFCVDNFKIYQNVTRVVDIDETDHGMMVDFLADKTIEIKESRNDKSVSQVLEESLCMKVGVDYALVRNERRAISFNGISCPPVKMVGADGVERVMIPLLQILDYIGYQYLLHPDNESFDITTGTSATYIAVGRESATVGGERVELSVAPGYNVVGDDKYIVVALDDIEALFPGWLVTYDNMGLIIIYEDITPDDKTDNAEIVNRDENLSLMLSLMKRFIFQNVEAEEIADSYNQTGTKIYNDVKKNTELKHPYLLANQNTFDSLKAAYSAEDSNLKSYIAKVVAEADAYYNEYAKLDGGEYAGVKADKEPRNPYSDGNNPVDDEDATIADTEDGYSLIGGRLNEVVEFSEVLPVLAFAYQVTGNAKYASLAFDYASILASWTHWGPGYFTNCAEATANFAIAYDWLYNAFVEAEGQEETDKLAQAIYELGVHDGYVSSLGKSCEHARVAGDESAYTTLTTNKNTVCSSGMIIGALAILDYAGKEGNENILAETVYLLGNNMINLGEYGLDEYAPDGSYIESATYWSYATNFFTRMVMALNSAAGNDYGFLDTWGMNTTAYYAAHIENSDGFIWNYHDGGADGFITGDIVSMDTQSLFFLGAAFNDKAIVAHREKQLQAGRAPSLYELLCYPEAVNVEDAKLTLNYHMQGIEAYVSRSDWDEGALYVGLMGGRNDAYHGQIDSGNFIYQNKGITWFMDLGSENYDTYQYFGSSRYKYYRASSEGNNVVILTSDQTDVAYGQYSKAGGKIYKTFENEHGSYALLDNTDVYLDTVSYAKRGMLVTNDGKTVVIQDEIYFQLVESVTWVAHTAQQITLNETGTVAYLTSLDENGDTITLRASLVTRTRDVTFEILDATENLLNGTYSASDSVSYGGQQEYSRDNIKKLAITQSGVLSLNVAVVFEIVESDESTEPVGYEWVTMENWEPVAASEGGEVSDIRDSAKRNDIMTFSSAAGALLKRDNVYTEQLESLYSALSQVAYTLETFKPENLSEQAVVNAYIDYLDYVDEYHEYRDFVNERVSETNKLVQRLFGYTVEADAE